jgi:hypothetical protein
LSGEKTVEMKITFAISGGIFVISRKVRNIQGDVSGELIGILAIADDLNTWSFFPGLEG